MMERHQGILDISSQDEDFQEDGEDYELPINNVDYVNIVKDSQDQNHQEEV